LQKYGEMYKFGGSRRKFINFAEIGDKMQYASLAYGGWMPLSKSGIV